MHRIATVRWHTPAPTSVDEELAVYDDGSAWLAVRVPRRGDSTFGTFTGRPAEGEVAALAAAGEVDVNLLAPATEATTMLADLVALRLLERAHATVSFATAARPAAGGSAAAVSLFVTAAGAVPLHFQLDVGGCAVHFLRSGQQAGWRDLPDLPAGFVTADAVGLGGVGRRAEVEPGDYGAIAFDVELPGETTEVAVQVAGWLDASLPDVPTPTRFEVRTAPAPLQDV